MTASRLWIIGGAIVAVLVLVLGWFLAVMPVLSAATAATAERRTVEALNASHETRLVEMREQFDNLDVIRAEVEQLRETLPSTWQYEDLVDYLAGASARNAASIVSFAFEEGQVPELDASSAPAAPAPEEPAGDTEASGDGAATPAASPAPVQASVPEGLHSIPFTITVNADEAGFIGFVQALQASPRLALVVSSAWTLDGAGGVGSGSVGGFLFVVPEAEAVAAAG